ncbi:MAG: YibE/F family protein [Firmicutes bacterium HGW-Firmicutes-11]|jgi:uncharacterized membrane protein|nr:MAG: YibE/F family protein [Firmicutes bacterium HGW-Firmicutes-11]
MKTKRNRQAYYLITVGLAAVLLWVGHLVVTSGLSLFDEEGMQEEFAKAKVISVEARVEDEYAMGGSDPVQTIEIIFTAKLLSGNQKNETVSASQLIDSSQPLFGMAEIEVGDRILLYYADRSYGEETEERSWQFAEFVRTDRLLYLGILLAVCLLIFGKKKGFNTILSLGFTCMAVFAVFIPSILAGRNIYFWSILTCLYTILMTYLIVNGYNRKTLAASLGCIGGILLAGLMTVIMDRILGLTGIVDDESIYLTYLFPDATIDLRAIIFAAIIIGAMGAVMDVAMSISSSLWEIREQVQVVSFDLLYRSGINIGKDIMGTMANTLILAYIGSSLSVVLLLTAYSTSISYLLNREMVVVEILQALVGSFGILLAMPFTSFICGVLYTRKKLLKADQNQDETEEKNAVSQHSYSG